MFPKLESLTFARVSNQGGENKILKFQHNNLKHLKFITIRDQSWCKSEIQIGKCPSLLSITGDSSTKNRNIHFIGECSNLLELNISGEKYIHSLDDKFVNSLKFTPILCKFNYVSYSDDLKYNNIVSKIGMNKYVLIHNVDTEGDKNENKITKNVKNNLNEIIDVLGRVEINPENIDLLEFYNNFNTKFKTIKVSNHQEIYTNFPPIINNIITADDLISCTTTRYDFSLKLPITGIKLLFNKLAICNATSKTIGQF